MKPRIAVLAALGAFLIGLSVATFAELRIFLQPILRGAVVTLQISVCAWLLFLLAAFFRWIGALSEQLDHQVGRNDLYRGVPRYIFACDPVLAVFCHAGIRCVPVSICGGCDRCRP